ncbi:hypothetical protein [Microlunatus speluncae]|uniref:hypothetical protein n=1 Tax=Microlunatus speluncae TaxID=2594267 RepID=UPI001266093C|nr:hypothetical protein [Microlunatus speluncae]
MSGVLRPVGPEPTGRYWIRRALVVGVVALSITLIVVAVRALGTPDPTSAIPPQASGTPTPNASAKTSSTPTPSGSPKPSGSATPSGSGTPSGSPNPSGTQAPGASPTPTAPTPSAPPKPQACKASDLRLTLIGKRSVRAQRDSSYQLSVINGGQDSCVVTVDQDTFELAITSGSDPIWSSDHCKKTIKPATKTLASEEALAWTMTWNGERSLKDCKNSSETPRAGIYWANAELDGGEPVKWRMTLSE